MGSSGRDADRERASRRRAAIRRHHPDAGGTAEALTAALAALDRGPAIEVTSTVRGRLRRFLRRRRGRPRRTLR